MTQRFLPTVLVIFGATGDLMTKKIIPSIFHLHKKGKLPGMFHVIGYSRRPLSHDEFRAQVAESLKMHKDLKVEPAEFASFLKLFFYEQGTFDNPKDYENLSNALGKIDGEWKVCANKLFYLAVPPVYYHPIFNNLASSGLTTPCSPEEGWTRVLVEKPFGKDLKTAEELDLTLGKLFKEEQIYRIDHYLAKEMLQNILAFRFSNNFFESSWNNQFIEKIEVRLLESIGVEERGAFYDTVGALRDVGQNHLLQMVALVTMDHPSLMDAENIRAMRMHLFQSLKPLTEKQIKNQTIRAQYDGFKGIKGVSDKSSTETYFKVQFQLNNARWQGVPIILEAGKRMEKAKKEIVVTFKHPTPCMCPPNTEHHLQNKVVFSLEPREEISISFFAKKPGLEMEIEEKQMSFLYKTVRRKSQFVEEYEKLLLDCILGNQLLFLSTEEVQSTWRFIDPILNLWQKEEVPLLKYNPGSKDLQKLAKNIDIPVAHKFKKEIGVIGLGKMGANMSRRLLEHGYTVVGYNRSPEDTKLLATEGLTPAFSLKELTEKLHKKRIVWLMLPAGKAIDEVLFGENGLVQYLEKGDIVIDAGNSFYKDAIRRDAELKKYGIQFMDVGFSGGPGGARNGACLMVGGTQDEYEEILPLFIDLALPEGVQFFEGAGAGHFTKMIHNGIEYGMMQAIAEGFEVLKTASYKLDIKRVAEIYNRGSVIESKLTNWLVNAFTLYGENLTDVSSTVAHTGEGAWTVEAATEMNIKVKVIEDALQFRKDSEKNPRYAGKVLSALRNMFGGHSVK